MRLLHVLKDGFVEPGFDLSPEEKKRIRKHGFALLRRRPMYQVIKIVMVVVATLAGFALVQVTPWLTEAVPSAEVRMLIGLVLMAVVATSWIALYIAFLWYTVARPIYRQAMCEHGVAVCIECGDDLRSVEAEHCPRCGAARYRPAEDVAK